MTFATGPVRPAPQGCLTVRQFGRFLHTRRLRGAGGGHVRRRPAWLDIRTGIAHCQHIISRITLHIDAPILRRIKALRKREGRSLGTIVSGLLAEAPARREAGTRATRLPWISHPMHALVDPSDKEAVCAVLDRGERIDPV
jgi:hypothetical protein